ncbi:MAG: 4Fe-4S binding protein [Clostridia bacterium]|nr:4Fe-4S binding protein [Clostridia bacterium]
MKKLKITDKTQCKACLACEVACSEAFYKVFNPELSCIRIEAGNNGEPAPKLCVQCGKCEKACTHGAISKNAKGVYMIDQKKCVQCGDCVAACPFHVMVKTVEPAKVSKCIACGICAKACPMGILEVVED